MKKKLLQGTLVDGKAMARGILDELAKAISGRPRHIPPPLMGIILAGNNHASEAYVRRKIEAASSIGISHTLFRLATNE